MASADFLAAPQDLGIDPASLELLFERAAEEVRAGLLPSCQIAIARRGKLAGLRTFGSVTCEGCPGPASNETLYLIFSATKAITSAAAWLLIQEGKLGVDELVADIVPEFASHGKQGIRVEQLFTHTAGFPHAPFAPAEFRDRERRLQRFAQWRLNWEPGTRFEYHPSSSMYVIAEIIERRSGRLYGEFVREHIALPLGLPELFVGLPRALHFRLADCVYVGEPLSDEDFRRMGLVPPPVNEVTEEAILAFNRPEVREAGVPGGGGAATAADLALFYQALLHGGALGGPRLWRAETLQMALKVRSAELTDPIFHRLANRALGVVVAGGDDRVLRSFGATNSELAFGHGGAGGQIAWADPASGISIGYCTSGHDRNALRMGARGASISARAASLLG